jgi:hypothetical protein
MPKRQKVSTTKITVENAIEVTDSLKDEIRTVETQHRLFIYRMMTSAAYVISLFQRSKSLEKKFIRHAKVEKANKGIATEVMFYIMRARTKKARQLAWKRGRVIDFLLEQGVKPGAMTTDLKNRGGLEAVCKQAARENPRRPAKSAGTNGSDEYQKLASSKGDKVSSPRAEPISGKRLNDQRITVELEVLLSERDALLDLSPGSKATLKIVRREGNDTPAKILKLRPVVKKVIQTPESDW